MQQNRADTPLVLFKDVVKEYSLEGYRVTAIKQANCAVQRGKMTFVYGPSGSGKSTFLNMLGLLDAPTHGQIFIEGTDISVFSDRQAADFRAQHIGFIFQSFNLIPVLTVQENVEFPLLRSKLSARQRRQQAYNYLEYVGLQAFASRRLNQISGGQRQRVAIARALVTTPSLIIADEPTANLDQATSNDIIQLMLEMKQCFNTTFVICTHNPDLLGQADQLINIVDGVIQSGDTV